MDIDEKTAVGGVAVVIGWLLSFFHQARRIGNMEEQFHQTVKLTAANTEAIEKLKNVHDTDMKEVREFFRTSSGGQKFMTFPDHDLICTRNMMDHAKDLRYLREAIDRQTVQLDMISSDVSTLKTDVAVLKTDMQEVKQRKRGAREGE